MKRAFAVLLLVTTAHSQVTPPALAARKRFAEKVFTRSGPVKVPAARDCLEYRPPAALGCSATAFLCPRGGASGTCSGSFSEQQGLVLYDHSPGADEDDPLPELVLSSKSGDDCPECECTGDWGIGFGPGVSPAEMERARKRAAVEQARRHEACVAEAARRQRREVVTRECQLLLVDPCRKEAFIRCTGRNGSTEGGDPPLGRTLHFSWAPPSDGGVARGGEWQREE